MQLLPEVKQKTPYEVMLDRMEVALYHVQPCGFDRRLDEAARKAKQDVIQAIQSLRTCVSCS